MNSVLDTLGSVLPYSMKWWEWDPKETWTSDQIPPMHGKVAIVTGGNGGVGLEVCFELMRHGAQVFLGARSEEKFKIAARRINERMKSVDDARRGSISYLPCDLSSIASARQSASFFQRESTHLTTSSLHYRGSKRLDIFIACAGVASGSAVPNQDGIEPLIATNCINQYVMLKDLLPLLIRTSSLQDASRRIVFLTSVAHRWCDFPFWTVRPSFASWQHINDPSRSEKARYSQSKLAQILLTERLQMTLRNENIACLAVHPGELNNSFVLDHFFSKIQAWRFSYLILPIIKKVLLFVLLDEHEGARTCLFAATASEIDQRQLQCVIKVLISPLLTSY